MPMTAYDDYSSNPYKPTEMLSDFGSLMIASVTECALFEYGIGIHIASAFGITVDFFRIRPGLQEQVTSLFFNFYIPKYVHMPFKAYIYIHSDHSSQFLF